MMAVGYGWRCTLFEPYLLSAVKSPHRKPMVREFLFNERSL